MAGVAQDVAKRVTVLLLARVAAALIAWTYNLGDGSRRASALLARLNAGDKSAVPAEMRKWGRQNGKALVGLLRRRWAEAAIFTGLEPMNVSVRAWKEIEALSDWPPFDV